MNKLYGAGLLAISCVLASVPAHAAVDLGTEALSDLNPGANFFSPISLYLPSASAGDYFKTFTFGFATNGIGAGNLSANLVGNPNTLFNSITLNGTPWTLSNGNQTALLNSAAVFAMPALNQVVVNFKVLSQGEAAFQGSVSASAVPEPSTWAMMLLGVGLIGFGLRRSRNQVTSKVNFAMS